MKYIYYFKENNILLDLKNNNLFMSIDTEKNNVDISNEYSKSHICIGVETNSKDLELSPPITIRIYNNNKYRIFINKTNILVFVENATIKLNSIYSIEIS